MKRWFIALVLGILVFSAQAQEMKTFNYQQIIETLEEKMDAKIPLYPFFQQFKKVIPFGNMELVYRGQMNKFDELCQALGEESQVLFEITFRFSIPKNYLMFGIVENNRLYIGTGAVDAEDKVHFKLDREVNLHGLIELRDGRTFGVASFTEEYLKDSFIQPINHLKRVDCF